MHIRSEIGSQFESLISRTIKYNLGWDYKIFRNVFLYSKRLNKFTEIDILLVTPFSIYCIEAKSYRTAIVGERNCKLWKAFTNKRVTHIFNPIIQNEEHIFALNEWLDTVGVNTTDLMIQNIIIVPNTCKNRCDCKEVQHLAEFERRLVRERNTLLNRYDIKKFSEYLLKIRVLQRDIVMDMTL